MNNSSVKVVLMVRRSRAFWLTSEIDPEFILGKDHRAAQIKAAVAWWDETFWLAYRDFRMELRSIAADAHRDAGFDEIIPWSDQSALEDQPPGTWLLPVDEDDWLSSDIADTLRGACAIQNSDLVTWDVVRKAADGRAKLNPNTFVESCGYAVRLPFDWGTIQNHMYLRPPRCRTVPIVLSVRNETPASMSFLYRNPVESVIPVLHQATFATEVDIPTHSHGVFSRYQQLLERLLRSKQKPQRTLRGIDPQTVTKV